MMDLSSIEPVARAAWRAARRFPLVLGASLVAAYAALALTNDPPDAAPYVRLLAAGTLGLPLGVALGVLAERGPGGERARWAVMAVGVLALVGFWAIWPTWPQPMQRFRYLQLSVAFHLMVAFLPYGAVAEVNGFWQYNRALFLRFLTAALYSTVLFGGLALALLALDKLLGMSVPAESYPRLWILMAFVFNTWFFISGVPEDFAALEASQSYPTGLRIFTQYVLVPIVTIYLAILTLYLGKVLITRQWPSGWIGWLVSFVAAFGTLSWLLVHPLEGRPEHAWVRPFTTGFYIALLPAIVMLWLSIWKRVAQYGITEPRYFLIVLSIWLAAIAVYYAVGRSRDIRVIPASLCLVALVTFAGPWGAYAVSRASQVHRLESILVRDGLLAGGVLRPATAEVSSADLREISAGFRYVLETHGEPAIASWLSDSLRRVAGSRSPRALLAALHLGYVEPWERGPEGQFSYNTRRPAEAVRIAGYTYALRISLWNVRDSLLVADGMMVRLAADSSALRVTRNGMEMIALPLGTMVEKAAAYRGSNGGGVPRAILCAMATKGDVAALACFTHVGGVRGVGGSRFTALDGELFLRVP